MQNRFAEKINYQLVLQVRSDSLADFDVMMELEQHLSRELKGIAEVDGHDMGCGEINIFILALNPIVVFERSKSILEKFQLLRDVKAGYRLVGTSKNLSSSGMMLADRL